MDNKTNRCEYVAPTSDVFVLRSQDVLCINVSGGNQDYENGTWNW